MRNISGSQREHSQSLTFYPIQEENISIQEDSQGFYTSDESDNEDH